MKMSGANFLNIRDSSESQHGLIHQSVTSMLLGHLNQQLSARLYAIQATHRMGWCIKQVARCCLGVSTDIWMQGLSCSNGINQLKQWFHASASDVWNGSTVLWNLWVSGLELPEHDSRPAGNAPTREIDANSQEVDAHSILSSGFIFVPETVDAFPLRKLVLVNSITCPKPHMCLRQVLQSLPSDSIVSSKCAIWRHWDNSLSCLSQASQANQAYTLATYQCNLRQRWQLHVIINKCF
jgi:hypothetical protein